MYKKKLLTIRKMPVYENWAIFQLLFQLTVFDMHFCDKQKNQLHICILMFVIFLKQTVSVRSEDYSMQGLFYCSKTDATKSCYPENPMKMLFL